ncbi:MAG: trigger factor [Oscillospiraceae bacterium]|jgi:trigger factor|nr:trigger factor [Oscillospiraceae bacterium]
MGLKSLDKIDANEYELEVEVSPQLFEEALEIAYKKKVKNITLPGFRKGKAPRAFVEKCYGDKVFFEEAIHVVYSYALNEAIKESKLSVIDSGSDFKLVKAEKEEGLIFKVKVTVKPDVKLGEYKGLKVTQMSLEVSEKDIDLEISKVAEQNARLVTVEDKPAKIGDTVIIDFEGFIDGEPLEDGKASNFNLKLGSSQFVEGFENNIVGHKLGENFEFTVKFPAGYPVKKIRGKIANFKVNIKKIQALEMPEIDDEFVKDVSEFDSIDEYREFLKQEIRDVKRAENRTKMENELSQQLESLVSAEIPDVMIKKRFEKNFEYFKKHLDSMGLDIDTYLEYSNINAEKLNEDLIGSATHQIKVGLAIGEISELENISITKEDVRNKCDQMLKEGYTPEKIESTSKTSDFASGLIQKKVYDFLIENAENVEKKKISRTRKKRTTTTKTTKTRKATTKDQNDKTGKKITKTKKESGETKKNLLRATTTRSQVNNKKSEVKKDVKKNTTNKKKSNSEQAKPAVKKSKNSSVRSRVSKTSGSIAVTGSNQEKAKPTRSIKTIKKSPAPPSVSKRTKKKK